jgi:hypothetical protein
MVAGVVGSAIALHLVKRIAPFRLYTSANGGRHMPQNSGSVATRINPPRSPAERAQRYQRGLRELRDPIVHLRKLRKSHAAKFRLGHYAHQSAALTGRACTTLSARFTRAT